MNKLKIAKSISTITNPPIITIPLFLIICAILSFENGSFDFSKFIVLELISLVFSSLLPLAIILFWAKKLNTDRDISNRSDRYIPLIVGIVSYFIGFLICLFLNLDNFLTLLLLCYSVNTGVVLLFTTQWKISVHTTGLSGPVAALILLLGPIGSLLGILYPMVIWSRVLLKKHTLSQAICGGVQGFFLTVLEMSILFILAIIMTPVLLGILSYVKVSHSKRVFYIAEIVLLLGFWTLTPIEVTAIFVLISAASILISSLAGDEFIWNRVIF